MEREKKQEKQDVYVYRVSCWKIELPKLLFCNQSLSLSTSKQRERERKKKRITTLIVVQFSSSARFFYDCFHLSRRASSFFFGEVLQVATLIKQWWMEDSTQIHTHVPCLLLLLSPCTQHAIPPGGINLFQFGPGKQEQGENRSGKKERKNLWSVERTQ